MNPNSPEFKAAKLVVKSLAIFGSLMVTFGLYLLNDPTRQTLAAISIGLGLFELIISYRTHMKMYSR